MIARQAALVAQWLCVGFIHGVMNTDNVSIAGETIDYGPCAFMDAYHPETVFSSIDQTGRYAYAKQPQIAGWNMARLGEALMPLFSGDPDEALKQANELLQTYNVQFGRALIAGLRRKLGLFTEQDGDGELAQAFFNVLADNGIDFTQAFRRLGEGTARGLFDEPAPFDAWEKRWRDAHRPGAAGRGDAARRHACGQPDLHPAQSSRRSGPQRRDRARRLRSVRGIADGAGPAVRGATGIRRLRPAAQRGRAAKLPNVLWHLIPAPSERQFLLPRPIPPSSRPEREARSGETFFQRQAAYR